MDEKLKELDQLVDDGGMGYVQDTYDPRDFEAEAFMGGEDSFPDEFLIDVPFVTYQGRIPSCTAHATTTMKWAQENVRLSPRFNFSWTKYYDGYKGWGSSFRQAIGVLQKKGAVEEEKYPDENKLSEKEYTDINLIPAHLLGKAKEHMSKSYVRLTRTPMVMKKMLMQYNTPILCGMPWYKSYSREIKKDGYLPKPEGSGGGHAFICIGWRTKDGKIEFIFQNSFGKWWGDNGRFYIPANDLGRLYSGLYVTIDKDVEEARKIDTEHKKSKKKPMIDLRKLQGDGKTLIFDADNGVFYLNVGDKLLKVDKERAAEAALMAVTRAGFGLGIKEEYLDGLTIERF